MIAMKWEYTAYRPFVNHYGKHHGIKCLTCNSMLNKKTECFQHMNHDVVYLGKDGEVIR